MKCAFSPVAAAAAAAQEDFSAAVRTVEACSAQIDALNRRYHAFSHLATDVAEQLEALRARGTRGPLAGVAASVKGNIPVAGLPFTEGSAVFAERRAREDAGIVRRLREAGAIVLGTTTLSELAMYGVRNPFEPMGLNPWDPDRTAGGSSTGAGVAAALGMAHLNIGSDSGGSIRNPACHCGVVGLMPRIGRLTLAGKPNHSPSLASVGIVARTVEDVRVGYHALAEPVVQPAGAPTRRLMIPRRLVDEMCDRETLDLFAAALARLAAAGFDLVERDINGWIAAERGAGVISLHESGKALEAMDLSQAGEGIRRRRDGAARLTSQAVEAARVAGLAFANRARAALDETDADAFVSPTWPFPAPELDAETMEVQGEQVPVDPHRNCFVRVGNAIDACAISLPMGVYACGVPAGLHLMAVSDEPRLLAVAALAEAAMPRIPAPPPVRDAQHRAAR